MTERFENEISACLARAEQSLQAARELASGSFYDFAASRAYYAAFYAASALLLREGMEFSEHPVFCQDRQTGPRTRQGAELAF